MKNFPFGLAVSTVWPEMLRMCGPIPFFSYSWTFTRESDADLKAEHSLQIIMVSIVPFSMASSNGLQSKKNPANLGELAGIRTRNEALSERRLQFQTTTPFLVINHMNSLITKDTEKNTMKWAIHSVNRFQCNTA